MFSRLLTNIAKALISFMHVNFWFGLFGRRRPLERGGVLFPIIWEHLSIIMTFFSLHEKWAHLLCHSAVPFLPL